MKKSTSSPKTMLVTFTTSVRSVEKLDELLEEEGQFLSRGGVIRAAIGEFYDNHRPKYIYEKSPAMKQKRKEEAEAKTYEQMTDEDYAKSLQGIILKSRTGLLFAAFLSFGKQTTAVRLDGLKKWKGTEQFDVTIEEHLRLTNEGVSLEEQLKSQWSIKEFDREYDIDLSNQ